MSLGEWDDELSVVSKEIETVRHAHSKSRLTGNKALIARKVSIIQAQIALDRNIGRLKKLCERDFLLLPREKTMLHWGQVYLEKVQKHVSLKTKLLTRGLWLKLIKTRVMGDSGGVTADIDADDLVALAIRQANLSKTEKYLADSLIALRQKKKVLTTRYEQLGIADANRHAATSLSSRLGLTAEDALGSPHMKALEALLRRAAAPVTAAPEQQRYVDFETRYVERTESLIGICRNLVVSRLKDPESRPTARVLDKFQLAMQQLADLEDETRIAYDQIMDVEPAPARPNLVQKEEKPAKTVPSA